MGHGMLPVAPAGQYAPEKVQSLQCELAVLRSSSLYLPALHGMLVEMSGQKWPAGQLSLVRPMPLGQYVPELVEQVVHAVSVVWRSALLYFPASHGFIDDVSRQ